MADNAGPLTLLNCDNVRHNGERFHDGLVEFLQLTGKRAVIAWLAANATCPNTMVDRITPRPASDLPARIKAQTGIDDKAPVMGETFIQWVVEDNFRAERPNLEAVGVEMVDSVIPYEEAKIRILNASHSCIAWAGTLMGQRYIHESTLTECIYAIADRYVTEDVIPCRATTESIWRPTATWSLSASPTPISVTPISGLRRTDSQNPGDDRPDATGVLPARRFARRRRPCCPRCSLSLWSSGTKALCLTNTGMAFSMLRRSMKCLKPATRLRFMPKTGRCLVPLTERADFLALMREKIAAVYSLIQ